MEDITKSQVDRHDTLIKAANPKSNIVTVKKETCFTKFKKLFKGNSEKKGLNLIKTENKHKKSA